jgi:hypothetical protein
LLLQQEQQQHVTEINGDRSVFAATGGTGIGIATCWLSSACCQASMMAQQRTLSSKHEVKQPAAATQVPKPAVLFVVHGESSWSHASGNEHCQSVTAQRHWFCHWC